MREISVTGNLGADAEILTDKNGSNYMRLRLANHEFGDAENETRWFDVTLFSIPRIAQFLKKGTGVRVIGSYKDSTYQSDKYGTQINRNIIGYNIDFYNNGKREEGEQQTEVKAASTEQVPVATEKPKASKTTKAAKAAPVIPTDGGEDDLPF